MEHYATDSRVSAFRRDYAAQFKSVQMIFILIEPGTIFVPITALEGFQFLGMVNYSSFNISLGFFGRDEVAAQTDVKPFLEALHSMY